MNNITIEEALHFAEKHFPNAPERLVDYLGIEVRYSAINCDGWCLQHADRAVIRINSEISDVRKRFTLAHELGHLIYGVTTVVGEHVTPFRRKSREEIKIDKFAAEILLPTSVVLDTIRKEIPITAKVLQRFAKRANVSQSTIALRAASLTSEIGLSDASVVLYENDELKWQWSETLRLTEDTPAKILEECAKCVPNPARIPHGENEVIVASFIENPSFKTKVLFLQLVDEFDGYKQLREERMRELEEYLFEGSTEFRQSLAGRFGAFKNVAQEMFLDEAIKLFISRILRNPERLNIQRLMSEKGHEYIRLKLQMWTRN